MIEQFFRLLYGIRLRRLRFLEPCINKFIGSGESNQYLEEGMIHVMQKVPNENETSGSESFTKLSEEAERNIMAEYL